MRILPLFLFSVVLTESGLCAEKVEDDAVELGLREAYSTYKKGDNKAVLEQLRALVKLMEKKAADEVGELLPETVGDWKGESMKRDDLTIAGGGISISRTYILEEKQVTVKVIKDAPVLKPMVALLGNKDLLALSNRKTSRISGETAVMEGEHKLQMVLDERIYVEFSGNDKTDEQDLVSLARKFDQRALAKLE